MRNVIAATVIVPSSVVGHGIPAGTCSGRVDDTAGFDGGGDAGPCGAQPQLSCSELRHE